VEEDVPQLDLDDIAGAEESDICGMVKKYHAWLDFTGCPMDSTAPGKKIHKSSILRLFSSPFSVNLSDNRLERILNHLKFRTPSDDPTGANFDGDEATMVTVEDPIVTLVRCNNLVFVALIQLAEIKVNATPVLALSAGRIHKPNIRLRGQSMCLEVTDDSYQPGAANWEWTGFEKSASTCFRDIEGNFVDLINPQLAEGTMGENKGCQTALFCSDDICSIGAILYERIRNDLHRLPDIPAMPTFPYRLTNGSSLLDIM
jgi:hypothetical protein